MAASLDVRGLPTDGSEDVFVVDMGRLSTNGEGASTQNSTLATGLQTLRSVSETSEVTVVDMGLLLSVLPAELAMEEVGSSLPMVSAEDSLEVNKGLLSSALPAQSAVVAAARSRLPRAIAVEGPMPPAAELPKTFQRSGPSLTLDVAALRDDTDLFGGAQAEPAALFDSHLVDPAQEPRRISAGALLRRASSASSCASACGSEDGLLPSGLPADGAEASHSSQSKVANKGPIPPAAEPPKPFQRSGPSMTLDVAALRDDADLFGGAQAEPVILFGSPCADLVLAPCETSGGNISADALGPKQPSTLQEKAVSIASQAEVCAESSASQGDVGIDSAADLGSVAASVRSKSVATLDPSLLEETTSRSKSPGNRRRSRPRRRQTVATATARAWQPSRSVHFLDKASTRPLEERSAASQPHAAHAPRAQSLSRLEPVKQAAPQREMGQAPVGPIHFNVFGGRSPLNDLLRNSLKTAIDPEVVKFSAALPPGSEASAASTSGPSSPRSEVELPQVLQVRVTLKFCCHCQAPYTGFGPVCSRCRRSGQRGSIQQCSGCANYFNGYGDTCAECNGTVESVDQ